MDPWLPGDGAEILIPTRFVLPERAARRHRREPAGAPALLLTRRPKPGEPRVVRTYPISTAKMDWNTPLGVTRIVTKEKRPNWYPPASVREEHEKRGDPLPRVVPPGPDNPLGEHKMRLDIPGGAYLIHGTNRPAGVGMQVTHGCIRMYPEDVAELFDLVEHQYQGKSDRSDDQGRLAARNPVRRASCATRGHEQSRPTTTRRR